MPSIVSFSPNLLPQTLDLINLHIGSVVPGWAITGKYLADALERYPQETITEPWVTRRQTLCALEHGRVVAAAHLLAYGCGVEVSQDYQPKLSDGKSPITGSQGRPLQTCQFADGLRPYNIERSSQYFFQQSNPLPQEHRCDTIPFPGPSPPCLAC